jgi:hypothetical protein
MAVQRAIPENFQQFDARDKDDHHPRLNKVLPRLGTVPNQARKRGRRAGPRVGRLVNHATCCTQLRTSV